MHILTGGNVDLLAHLRWLMKFWPKMRHVFVSAWAISAPDILLAERWLTSGEIESLELLLGDIFPRKYVKEWEKLTEMRERGLIGRLYSSSIHSKLILAESADGVKIVVESSANCNMNPRIEQSCVTVSDVLHDFYYSYLREVLDNEEAAWTARETMKLYKTTGHECVDDDEGASLFGQDHVG